jgi:hypothetical protein
LPHWTPYESEHVKSTPLDPPQLDAAHAASTEATATLAAAAKKRFAEVAPRERY